MPSKDITYTTRNNEILSGYMAEPSYDGKIPGILLITAIFGIDDEMKELSDAWAADGFIVSVPDIFWRVMPGPTADMEKAFNRYKVFDSEQGYKDVEDLLNALRAHPRCNGKVGVLGFCFGGRYAQHAVSRLGADAAGAFHGTLIDQELSLMPPLDCPVSFHFGAEDPVVPPEVVDQISAAYADHPDAEIVSHNGCGHNFSMPYKDGYHAAVAATSRQAVLETFMKMK
ncbi:MAG: Carboxymethylenebutenolidase [Alphaproteobacteria bacterium MarineAlpha11_Bin1]|nr:MAG: Carboxymethylenebutenolidase [Alphaproteobacteria bacterium MarineAlpha11_Bin1]|tara:strand:+ start:6534 stop:7217 length:684 start_codon:yes stop_codon:yes gene_type:complete